MATATATAPKPTKLRKCAAYQAQVQRWQDWKNAGKAPSSRGEALTILSNHITCLGNPQALRSEFVKLKLAHSRAGINGDQLNDSLSFIVWDISENSGRAMNYGIHTNFFQGLLQQASNLIYTYTRISLKIGSVRVTMPTVVSSGNGAMRVEDISATDLQRLADDFVDDAKVRLLRWKTIGADANFMKRTLRKLTKAVLSEV